MLVLVKFKWRKKREKKRAILLITKQYYNDVQTVNQYWLTALRWKIYNKWHSGKIICHKPISNMCYCNSQNKLELCLCAVTVTYEIWQIAPFLATCLMWITKITLTYITLQIHWILARKKIYFNHRQCHPWYPVPTDIVPRTENIACPAMSILLLLITN